MYREWPYFNTNLDLVDMILAKAEADIAGQQAVTADLGHRNIHPTPRRASPTR